MFCWNCGKEMDDDLLFCPHCAIKQAGIPEPKPKRKVPLIPLVCIAACVLVLTVALSCILMVSRKGPYPTRPVDPYSVELPDLASFLNTQYSQDDVSAYTHYVTCTLRGKNGKKAAEEFAKLLQEDCWQLVLDNSWDYSESGALCTDYIFHYTGKGDGITWVPHADGYKYHAKLSVHEHASGSYTITFYTAPGFLLTDPGVDARAIAN